MAHDGQDVTNMTTQALLPDLLALTGAAVPAVETVFERARDAVRAMVTEDGRISNTLIEANQTASHGLAWLATYQQALNQMQRWAQALQAEGKFGEMEQLLHQIAFGEYLHQVAGGIPMNQGEVVRLQDLGLGWDALSGFQCTEVQTLMAQANTQAARTRLVELMQDQAGATMFGASGLSEELEMIRDQFRRYAQEKVEPNAHDWHLQDKLIPIEIIEELAEMGVFGLTIPEEFGGFGLSKASMCVVSEELSRGYIGVGSLATRSEIAAELIIAGGTDTQKANWLPKIASAEILPTAVFHRTQHRIRSGQPAHPCGQRRERRLQDHWQQDLDHPRRANPRDDLAGANQPRDDRSPGPVDVPGGKNARHR